jgi:hypothetical protein
VGSARLRGRDHRGRSWLADEQARPLQPQVPCRGECFIRPVPGASGTASLSVPQLGSSATQGQDEAGALDAPGRPAPRRPRPGWHPARQPWPLMREGDWGNRGTGVLPFQGGPRRFNRSRFNRKGASR